MSAHVMSDAVLSFFFFFASICSQLVKIGTCELTFGIINLSRQIYVSVLCKEGTGRQILCQKLSNSRGVSACRLFSISVEHNEASFSITKYPSVLYFLISRQW